MAEKIDLKEFNKAMDMLTKKFGEKTVIANVTEANLTRSILFDGPLFNYVLGGKYVTGRIMQLFGPESSGKSTISTYIGGQMQRKIPEQPFVVYLDYERTFDPLFAQRLKLNIDKDHFKLFQPDTMEDGFEIAETLIKTGLVSLIIFDSEAAAPTRKQADSEYGQADFGIAALQMAKGLKKLNIQLAKYNTSMIVISQERDNQQVGSHAIISTGGRALKFFASTRNRVVKTGTIEKDGETIGIEMKFQNYKNKTGVMFRMVENLKLYFDSGFDEDDQYGFFFTKLNIIKQKGAWFYLYENEDVDAEGNPVEPIFKCSGLASMNEYLKSHPDILDKLKQKVLVAISKETKELDSHNMAPRETENDSKEESLAEKEIAALAEEAMNAASGEQ